MGGIIMNVSLIYAAFKRPQLLDLTLWSLSQQTISHNLEIIVVNDGIEDDTEKVCKDYNKIFDIKYLFSGQRNRDGIKPRMPGFALNIGVKQSKGEIAILSCPEVYCLNNTVDLIVEPLKNNPHIMSVPHSMLFDDDGIVTQELIENRTLEIDINRINKNRECVPASQMPFFMGFYKYQFMEMGGYDEDFTGYAGDDNDLVDRFKHKGVFHLSTTAKVVHLYHGATCDGKMHPENPAWVHNWTLLNERRGQIIRNQNREWGKL